MISPNKKLKEERHSSQSISPKKSIKKDLFFGKGRKKFR